MNGVPVPNIPPITVEVDGIYNLFTNLDPHKAPGPNNIPTKLLKGTAQQMLSPLLTIIFQASLNQGKTSFRLEIS